MKKKIKKLQTTGWATLKEGKIWQIYLAKRDAQENKRHAEGFDVQLTVIKVIIKEV